MHGEFTWGRCSICRHCGCCCICAPQEKTKNQKIESLSRTIRHHERELGKVKLTFEFHSEGIRKATEEIKSLEVDSST